MSEIKNYLEVIEVPYEDEEGSKVIDVEVVEEKLDTEEEECYKKVDTSFKTYNKEKENTEKRKRKKWFSRIIKGCKKIILTVITVPVAILIGGMTIGVVGIGFCMSMGAVLAGIAAMGMAAFVITAYSQLMGMFMLFVALGLMSSGGLLLCLMVTLFRGVRNSIRWIKEYKMNRVEEK